MRRLVLVGGGREGLETLAHAVRQKDWSVALVVDPDSGALVFRLGDLGFQFAEPHRVPLDTRIEAVREVGALDLAVDTLTDRRIRRTLGELLPGVDVIGSATLRLLWTLEDLPLDARPRQSLERLRPVLDQIDVAAAPGELAYAVTELMRLNSENDVARLYRWDDVHRRLSAMGSPGTALSVSAAALSVARERRAVVVPSTAHSIPWLQDDDGAKAVLAVPIQSEDDLLGVLELRRTTHDDPFPPGLQAWMEELAHHVVRPLKKIRTLRELREAAQAESVRRDIKTLLAADRPVRDTLQQAAELIATILQAVAVHIYVRDPQNGDVLLQASTAIRLQNTGGLRIALGAGFIGEVAVGNRPLILREQRTEAEPDDLGATRAMIAVPLSAGRAAVGVLVAETPPATDVTPRMLGLMTEIADTLGASIASETERHKMSQKVMKLSVVNEEGLQLLSIRDREKVAMAGAASTAMILDAEAVVLRVRERKGSRLLVGGTYGLHRDDIDAALIQLDQAVASRVADGHIGLRSETLSSFGVVLPEGFPYRSVLAVPLLAGDQVAGTIAAYNKVLYQSFACGAFDRDDQEILEKFSFYLGRALVQAQEHRERQALITIDEVTGLRNRRYLDMRLPEETRRAERYERKVSLLVMEVIAFDELARGAAPAARDEMLRALGGMVHEFFRNVDVVARIHDARFAVVMPDTGERVGDILERLAHAVTTFRLSGPDGAAMKVRWAVGMCTFPTEAATVQELMERAERLTPLEE